MRALALVAMSALLGACEPRAALSLDGEAGGYQVRFENCTRPDQALPVRRLEIRREAAGDGEPPLCSLERTGSAQALAGAWTYGQTVPGYEMRGCAPLPPGASYRLHASLGPVAADAVVKLGPDGAVEGATGCP